MDIIAGNLVWVEGPYPAGTPDITIFRNGLSHHLDPFEHVEADDGYIGEAPRQVKCPKSAANPTENLGMQSRVRSRHETLNGRFKCWGILKQIYQHDVAKHSQVFWAIAVIIQLAINDGQALFGVEYSD